MRCLRLFFFLLSLSLPLSSYSEEDRATNEALEKTKELLKNKSMRNESIKDNPDAQKVNSQVEALAGANTEDVFALSAEIFESLVRETKGDPVKMEEILKKALKDPSGFASKFTDSQKSALKAIEQNIQKLKAKP